MNVLDVDDVTERMKRIEGGVRSGAHKAWLAGLGAAALVEEETRGFFDTLVARGEGVESRGKRELDRARQQFERARERVTRNVEEMGTQVDRRMTGVLHRLGVPTRNEIHALTRRVEELTGRVATTAAAPAAAPAATPGAKPMSAPAPVVAEPVAGAVVVATAVPARKVYRVLWSAADGQWRVELEGAARATSVHPTKDAAVTAARELARRQEPSRVVVERMDGTVQGESTYDPADA